MTKEFRRVDAFNFCGRGYMRVYILPPMNTTTSSQELLDQVAAIEFMERGCLCIIRQGPDGPYYNLQRRVGGRQVTEYVPRDQVPVLQQHIAAHERFVELMTQYEQALTERSRALRKAGAAATVQKKRRNPRTSTLPARPRSKG